MSATATSSIEKVRPRAVFQGNPMVLYVALAVLMGWLGVHALMDAIRESRERDAVTVQGFLDSRTRAEDDHRHAAVAAPVKAVPGSVAAAKQKAAAAATPALKTPAGRTEGERKTGP